MRWEVERDRFGVMFSGPLEVGECVEVVPASFTDEDVERVAEALYDRYPSEWLTYEGDRGKVMVPWVRLQENHHARRQAIRNARAALSAYLEPTTKGNT